MKLGLRDLFWLFVTIGLALGWWRESRLKTEAQLELPNQKYRVNFLMEYLENHGFEVEVDQTGAIEITPP